jgi:hypothetical protein
MFDLLPFYNVELLAKRLTKAGSYEIKEAGPLAVRGILVKGKPFLLSHRAVDV